MLLGVIKRQETEIFYVMYVSKMGNNPKTSMGIFATVLVLGVQGIAGVAVTDYSCNPKAEIEKSFNITCSISGTIVNGIQWTRPDSSLVTVCSDTTNCLTFVPGYTIATATSSENVLHIANVTNVDTGKWICHDGPGGDKGCEMIVQKKPTTAMTILSKQQIYSVGDILQVSVDVKDYYCSKTPSFHLLLDSQREELDALPKTPLTILSGTQTKSITVTEDMTGSTKLVFNCRDDDVLFDENTFIISASDCSITVTVVMIIMIVIKVLAFTFLLIAIFCWTGNLKVIQGLYAVDVIVAVAAIIGGIVCLAVTVTDLTTREGSICNTDLGLSITCFVMGLLNPVFIIFFLGSVMDMAGVQNNPLAGHFCAFPRKNVDKPRRGENSPTNATVVDIGVTNSGNSRANGNHGKVPPKSKTNGPKASSLETHEGKNEDKVDNTNIRGLSLQPIMSNEKGDGHNGQTNNTNSKLETDDGEKKKGSKKKKKTKKKLSAENGDGSRSPPTVSVSGVDVDDKKTADKPEEQTGSLSKLTVVESPE